MNQVFFEGFFGLALTAVFVLEAGFETLAEAFGLPRVPASRMAMKSSSLYKPVDPIYLNGFIPAVLRRLLTAADETGFDEVVNRWAISNIVIPSIYKSLHLFPIINQVLNVKKLLHYSIYFDKISKTVNKTIGLLYIRIAVYKKFAEFLKISCQTLDVSIRRGYIIVQW